jgi:CRP/FNR family transcriptional regulator, nitrogen oxide reductase regulator
MGNVLKIVTEADFRPGCRRITSKDLNDRLLESIPAIDGAVSRTALEMDTGANQSLWQSAAIFKDLSDAECQEIVSSAAERQYGSRQLIVQEGDDGRAVLMVLWGRVKVSQVSHTGDEVILRVQGSGDVIGGLGMLPGESHSSTIRALEACKVISWTVEDFHWLCARYPALQRNALQIMSDTLHILQECFCEMATLRVPSRMARTLVRLAEQDGCERQRTPITFTCEELGQMTGTTLFTVSRLLCKWTEMGLIYPENRGVVIKDVGGLLAIADEIPRPARQMAIR